MKLRPSTSSVFFTAALLISHINAQITDAPNLSTVSNVSGNPVSSSTQAASTTTRTSASANPTITGSSATGSNTQTVPSLSSAVAGLTGLPKLSNGFTIPTAAVPSTAGAEYMRASSYPEGTIFIIVGAILAFVAATVIAWRGFSVWLLHKNTKRAQVADSSLDKKPFFRATAPPMYSYKDHESKASLSTFGAGKMPFGNVGGAMASAQSLFFSPTANAMGSSANQASNRNSSYLPAGYYAAGSIPHGEGEEDISLSTLAPTGRDGYSRADMETPPDSPGFPATRLGHHNNLSRSTLNLNARTPSAVLDDMFDYRNGQAETAHGGHDRQRSRNYI